MKPAPFNLLLQTASRDNILTLTTQCVTSCIFCSHNQNPPDVEAYSVDDINREQLETLIEFLDPDKKIVIGESATRICEGEPFLYPDLFKALKLIRRKFRDTVIQITTSGSQLDKDSLKELGDIGSVELNLSLNSCSPEGRELLYRGRAFMAAVEAARNMSGYGLAFSGSIVAMPHIVGWKDIEDTIVFLAENGASMIRLFTPGFTKYSAVEKPPPDIRDKLHRLADRMKSRCEAPILLEPPVIDDLSAVVEGVVRDSPFRRAGIVGGDVITAINGKRPMSRVDAYYEAFRRRDPVIRLKRGGEELELEVHKPAKAASGLITSFDIHPDTVGDLQRALGRNSGKRCLVVSSELAYDIIARCIEQTDHVRVGKVPNEYFGGNIMCAGLLTIEDIGLYAEKIAWQPEVLLLPSIMLDDRGRDLRGVHFSALAERLGITVEIV